MSAAGAIILSLAYILGLLSTATTWGKFVLLGLGIGAALILPRFWRTGPKLKLWLAAGIVGFLASLYFQARLPLPQANDISKFVPTPDIQEQVVTVQGVVASEPRLNRSERSQFWLQVTKLHQVQNSNDTPADVLTVSGKLYVTMPSLRMSGIHQGDAIAVTGVLYKPNPAANPGAFDFKAYLAREGGFAVMRGSTVSTIDSLSKRRWGWWAIRQRIIRSQLNWLGSPEAPLVSSMVFGSKAVDLPYDIQDQFRQVGLAHTLAASGFQISLILGVVLALTSRLSAKSRFILGSIALVIFVGVTGGQPSILRAGVMGLGVLVALVMQRKTKPIGLLLVAATILLLYNPLWSWDVGFQLSFLATLGLLVTATPLIQQLDWLPPAIASLIAVPLAATLWVLPLQINVFGLVAPYSIAANIITTPLISVITIGGVISALAGLIWPLAGSALAWLLYYPTHWLIAIVEFFCWLPGNSVAVARISVLQLIALYGLIVLVWQLQWWHRRWWLAATLAVAMVAIPLWQTNLTLFRVTVLATGYEPVMVVQDRGKILLVNTGDAKTVSFTVLPFLRQQGVNQLDWVVALDGGSSNGWLQLLKRIPCKTCYIDQVTENIPAPPKNLGLQAILPGSIVVSPLPVDQTVPIGSITMTLISAEPSVLLAQIRQQNWLLLGDISPEAQKQIAKRLPRAQVLYWSGTFLSAELLDALQPVVAIAQASTIDSDTLQNLQRSHTKLYYTGRDGAIQWTPAKQFEPTLEATDNNAQLL